MNPATHWVPTGDERWVVLRRVGDVVHEQLKAEWIETSSGVRKWRNVLDAKVIDQRVVRQRVTRTRPA